MDYAIADYQDYEGVKKHLEKLAKEYKKVVEAVEEDRQTEQADLMEASEQAFSEWQDNYTDWS